MKNIIQLRNGFVNLPDNKSYDNYLLAMSVNSEMMQFGYILDQQAIKNLSSASKEDVINFHNEVIEWLKVMTGSTRSYTPFWKNFPIDVMSKSESELWLHQVAHYCSCGSYEPTEWSATKPTAFEKPNYTVITAGDENRYLDIFTSLVSLNSSLIYDDLEAVKYFVSSGVELRMPSIIPFKENLCTLAAMGLNVPVKTVTDVLRIVVHLSGGDISLPKVPFARIKKNSWTTAKMDNPFRELFKFKKFNRKERKYILGLLEQTNCDVREFVLKDSRWIRLGEILHPGEYKSVYPKAFELFDQIRNNKVKSWYGEVDSAFKKSYEDGINKLAERPGELCRRIDALVRTGNTEQKALLFSTLKVVLPLVSNKVIYELFSHFEKRSNDKTGRSIMVKGARKRTALPDLKAIEKSDLVIIYHLILETLSSKFSLLPALGSVWIDEELKKIPLPANMRSINSALKPIIRGQRIPVGNNDTKVIRSYVHWFDERGTRDLDLTATLIGMGKSIQIGWNGDHSNDWGCYSGDIRHRQGACAEYIDINLDKANKDGYKYAILDVRNYNGGTLAEITDCVFGFMEREYPVANEVFLPATLANSMRLQSPASSTIAIILDLETKEYIFMDIDMDGIPVASANMNEILEAIKPYTDMPSFSVFDLLSLHITARGVKVEDPKLAETILSVDKFSTSYVEILQWMGI